MRPPCAGQAEPPLGGGAPSTHYFLLDFFSQALSFFLLCLNCLRHCLSALASFDSATGGLQPDTGTFVFWLITTPFWPVIVVGITSLVPHRLKCLLSGTLEVSAECGPSGRTVSNVVTGASGTELKV